MLGLLPVLTVILTVAFVKHTLVFQGEFPGFAGVGMDGIIRNAEGNFAGW